MNNIEKNIKAESPVRVQIIKPRIGKTCVCHVCHLRQPFKKILKILDS